MRRMLYPWATMVVSKDGSRSTRETCKNKTNAKILKEDLDGLRIPLSH